MYSFQNLKEKNMTKCYSHHPQPQGKLLPKAAIDFRLWKLSYLREVEKNKRNKKRTLRVVDIKEPKPFNNIILSFIRDLICFMKEGIIHMLNIQSERLLDIPCLTLKY